MPSAPLTADEYLNGLSPERRAAITAVRQRVLDSLPDGYVESMQSGMIAWVVPLSTLPDTYNGRPLMYAALASQKRHMSLHLMSVYSDPELAAWFAERYRATGKRLDMGKSCVRFKSLDDLPLELVGEAIGKTPVDKFIDLYRAAKSGAGTRTRG